uniref:Uncharacterized protein n=1 Tax=Panagrolaimus sp. JU765 TaxID=591449 RepID=A0AC34PUG1_9BILA
MKRGRSPFAPRPPSPGMPSGRHSSAHLPNGPLFSAANGHAAPLNAASTSGSGVSITSSTAEGTSVNGLNNFQACCYQFADQQQHCPHIAAVDSSAMINGSIPQTIEDQIRVVDKVIKDCDSSRKNLELISRRLDDLNDEVKRYRDFLGHEKSRRDPTSYKTMSSEQTSPYNENICGIMSNLTFQLTKEWNDKLGHINCGIQTPSTPSSKVSDRN